MDKSRYIRTQTQISAGGVAYRLIGDRLEIVLISVGEIQRWQLPKGLVGEDETSEQAAIREVREEAGVETQLIDKISKIEYWYISKQRGQNIRFHKYVDFYLLSYLSGDPEDHDQEVNAAQWFEIDDAIEILTFDSERDVVKKARELIFNN